jgi:hypothetical protein
MNQTVFRIFFENNRLKSLHCYVALIKSHIILALIQLFSLFLKETKAKFFLRLRLKISQETSEFLNSIE